MTGPRIRREKKTVSAMVVLYCKGVHHGVELCRDCRELLDYSMAKLDKCMFSESKPTCARCPVHCFEKAKRDRMRTVMRYSGPRMLTRHPILTILHAVDGRAKPRTRDPERESKIL